MAKTDCRNFSVTIEWSERDLTHYGFTLDEYCNYNADIDVLTANYILTTESRARYAENEKDNLGGCSKTSVVIHWEQGEETHHWRMRMELGYLDSFYSFVKRNYARLGEWLGKDEKENSFYASSIALAKTLHASDFMDRFTEKCLGELSKPRWAN